MGGENDTEVTVDNIDVAALNAHAAAARSGSAPLGDGWSEDDGGWVPGARRDREGATGPAGCATHPTRDFRIGVNCMRILTPPQEL